MSAVGFLREPRRSRHQPRRREQSPPANSAT
jgi:hypothetical protein